MRGTLDLRGDTQPTPCAPRSLPRHWITERVWRMCRAQPGMPIHQPQNFIVEGGIIQRSRRAFLPITERGRSSGAQGGQMRGIVVLVVGILVSASTAAWATNYGALAYDRPTGSWGASYD